MFVASLTYVVWIPERFATFTLPAPPQPSLLTLHAIVSLSNLVVGLIQPIAVLTGTTIT